MTESDRVRRGTHFPIAEAYGYPYDSTSVDAHSVWESQWCPFMESRCEKHKQYGFGYCSVVYSATWDSGTPKAYAVCDHRLDGAPINWAVADHFGSTKASLVPEVTATFSPKLSIDYVAFADDPSCYGGVDLIAIEAQTIDLRGGGVGPAWDAWENNDVINWREYFTREAQEKGRRDTIDYGINTGNVYKRLGTQVAEKGEYFKKIGVPFYVVMQHSILGQLRSRVDFATVKQESSWDITFVSFDYTGAISPNGQLEFEYVDNVRTTLDSYVEAMHTNSAASQVPRSSFIEKVKRKAGQGSAQPRLF